MQQMFEAQTMDFPFVAELPKRERSKVASLWDRFQEIKAITDQKGMLLPVTFAANLLGVSRQRVHDIIREGKMESIEINGLRFITEESFIAWCKLEHKAGRPVKVAQTSKECFQVASKTVKELAGR